MLKPSDHPVAFTGRTENADDLQTGIVLGCIELSDTWPYALVRNRRAIIECLLASKLDGVDLQRTGPYDEWHWMSDDGHPISYRVST